MGDQIFARGVTISDDPLRKRGLRSRPFDGEGLPVGPSDLVADGVRRVVDAAPTDPQRGGLPRDRQQVRPADDRFAPSQPALVSAYSKKSFSRVISPILAWNSKRLASSAKVASPFNAAGAILALQVGE